MVFNSSTVSLCISLTLQLMTIIMGILYLVYIDLGYTDNKFGEVSLYLFVISFLACIISTSIKDEANKSSPTKVIPV